MLLNRPFKPTSHQPTSRFPSLSMPSSSLPLPVRRRRGRPPKHPLREGQGLAMFTLTGNRPEESSAAMLKIGSHKHSTKPVMWVLPLKTRRVRRRSAVITPELERSEAVKTPAKPVVTVSHDRLARIVETATPATPPARRPSQLLPSAMPPPLLALTVDAATGKAVLTQQAPVVLVGPPMLHLLPPSTPQFLRFLDLLASPAFPDEVHTDARSALSRAIDGAGM